MRTSFYFKGNCSSWTNHDGCSSEGIPRTLPVAPDMKDGLLNTHRVAMGTESFFWLSLILLIPNNTLSLIVEGKVTKLSGSQLCNILKQLTIRTCLECLRHCEENSDCEKFSCHKRNKVCNLCSSETINTQAVENIYNSEYEKFKSKISGKYYISKNIS